MQRNGLTVATALRIRTSALTLGGNLTAAAAESNGEREAGLQRRPRGEVGSRPFLEEDSDGVRGRFLFIHPTSRANFQLWRGAMKGFQTTAASLSLPPPSAAAAATAATPGQ